MYITYEQDEYLIKERVERFEKDHIVSQKSFPLLPLQHPHPISHALTQTIKPLSFLDVCLRVDFYCRVIFNFYLRKQEDFTSLDKTVAMYERSHVT